MVDYGKDTGSIEADALGGWNGVSRGGGVKINNMARA